MADGSLHGSLRVRDWHAATVRAPLREGIG
jgi:hypothetical protein